MNKTPLSLISPLILVFLLVWGSCYFGKNWLLNKGINPDVITMGNLVLFGVSLAAFFLNHRAIRSSSPQSFVRSMYASFMLRFFVLAIVAFIYIMIAKKNLNKPALGICGALYILYTVIEIRALTRLLKQKKNA